MKPNPLPIFSDRLYESRLRCGLTQSQLGRIAGVNQIHISNYETGRFLPGALKLRALADALHVTTDWLLGREEE